MEVNGFKGNEIICDAMRQVLDSCNLFTTFLEGILYRKSDDTKGARKIPSLFEFLAV